MRNFRAALRCFFTVLNSDEYAVISTKGKNYHFNGDISVSNFHYITKEQIMDTMAPYALIKQANEIINSK